MYFQFSYIIRYLLSKKIMLGTFGYYDFFSTITEAFCTIFYEKIIETIKKE